MSPRSRREDDLFDDPDAVDDDEDEMREASDIAAESRDTDDEEEDSYERFESYGADAIDDETEREPETKTRTRGRPSLARGERKLAKTSSALTPRAARVLKIVTDFIVANERGPNLIDINRALCEPGDHQGSLRTLASLKARGLVTWAGRDLMTMTLGSEPRATPTATPRLATAAEVERQVRVVEIVDDRTVRAVIVPPPPRPPTRVRPPKPRTMRRGDRQRLARCAAMLEFFAAIDVAFSGPLSQSQRIIREAAGVFAITMMGRIR